jgi:hypothetical protein
MGHLQLEFFEWTLQSSSEGTEVGDGGGEGAKGGGLEGRATADCEVEARSGSGPGEKPREFPWRSNHSTWHAHGEDRGGRSAWSGED